MIVGLATRRLRVSRPAAPNQPSMLRALAGLRHEGLVVLASVFAVSAMVEGGIATWGILFLRGHLGIGVLGGVGAYVVGASLATIARVGAGPRLGMFGSRRAVAIGGALAAAGIAAEACSSNPAVAATGLAVAAIGVSVVWPLLIADVSNQARHPAVAIGGITACGYLGMVIGPPIVGVLSSMFGARTGLLFLAGAALFVMLTPARIRARANAPHRPRSPAERQVNGSGGTDTRG
jgi:MFS family permease